MARGAEELYLGIDLGGTKIAVSLWSGASGKGSCRKLGRAYWETLPGGPEPNLRRMLEEGSGLLAAAARKKGGKAGLKAVGVSGGGPLDPWTGTILSIPNLPGWSNVPISRILSEHWKVPAYLENDANACAVAEWLHGAGKGTRHLSFLTCSTGIGAGLILDGRLFRGSRFLAGEVGHQVIVPGGLACGCGNLGCLEAYASGAGMARRLEAFREKDSSLPVTAREVVERAKEGDKFSVRFLRETADYLAMGLSNLVFLLNPERIVLGTIPTSAGDLFFTPLRESLSRRLWPSLLQGLEVVPSALWPDLGDHAALAVARDIFGSAPRARVPK